MSKGRLIGILLGVFGIADLVLAFTFFEDVARLALSASGVLSIVLGAVLSIGALRRGDS